MLCRSLPLLVCLIAWGVFGSKGSASFIFPDALPEVRALWSGGAPSSDSLPGQDDSCRGFGHDIFSLGFLLFADVSEVSAAVPGERDARSLSVFRDPNRDALRIRELSWPPSWPGWPMKIGS